MHIQSLGLEDPLEEGVVTHFSILEGKISWTEEPHRLYSPWGHKESDWTKAAEHACPYSKSDQKTVYYWL